MGRKKLPVYKIVAADSRAPRDGRFIESLGTYNPCVNPPQVKLSEDRIYHWLKCGAKPTETVRSLLSAQGVLMKLNLVKRGFDDARVKEEFEKWNANRSAKNELKRKGAKQQRQKKMSVEPIEKGVEESGESEIQMEGQSSENIIPDSNEPGQQNDKVEGESA